jgi:hypothetical protein
MPKFILSQKEINLVCDALEELYDNLQYNNISNSELRDQQIAISKIIGKMLKEEIQNA